MRDPRHDILFQPIQIGPKTAKNRFYQVPHCNGMGHREPNALAGMRGMKAAGGWAVVCTEEVEIHPSSEVAPAQEGRIWQDEDIPLHARVVEAIHEHGALAGCELVYNAPRTNLYSRMVPMGPGPGSVISGAMEPQQARVMDLSDIRALRRWHRAAALRARTAGYDMIFVYAGHGLTMTQQFLSRATNQRSDAYGGSLENRARLLRELIEDTRDAVGHDCAVPVRIAVAELGVKDGLARAEIEDLIGMLGELPDLWDFCMGSWPTDSQTSRFSPEGFQEEYFRGLKALTSKPVVGVGRYTSPDAMAALVKGGVMDLIGAARPSIADPFLPLKIAEGRSDDLRECIGCNICIASDNQSVPIRCTQNPTMGEEWRRGWHPEIIQPRASDARVLVVGAGPAGLEAAHQLGKRGYAVALAEAADRLGGRVLAESALPGLAAWRRVADYRIGQIERLDQLETYPASRLTAEDVLEFGATHVAIATGADWARNGFGRHHPQGFDIAPGATVLTPDDIFAGARPTGRVVVYDDDHYSVGGAIAELLALNGARVTLATPAPLVSNWTVNTLEQGVIEARLVAAGVTLATRTAATSVGPGGLHAASNVTGTPSVIEADAVVLVGNRLPRDGLAKALMSRAADWADAGLQSVTTIGDALAPAMIVHAVYQGHRYARELECPPDPDVVPFRRDLPR
ncbi:FAD-dependent oxidoreductase [Paracoccus pacificus]|uniref:FAD-dependent oxidoreductase n=1 Tax=Paracoccus pacificus TaxID=1463598 RepID=A0ABW4R2Q7_9RHOB